MNGPAIATSTDQLFQSDQQIAAAEEKALKSLNELGQPFRYPCKILKCVIDYDRKIAFLASSDHVVRGIFVDNGEKAMLFRGHMGPVTAIALYDHHYLITGSWDKTLILWDIETREIKQRFTGHTDFVKSILICGEMLVSGSADGTMRVWNIQTGVCTNVLLGHKRSVEDIVWDGSFIYSASSDGTIKKWRISEPEAIHTFSGHFTSVLCLAIDPANDVLYSGSADKEVKRWDLHSSKVDMTLVHPSWVRCISIGNNVLITGCSDGHVRKWNLQDESCENVLEGHFDDVSSVHCDPNVIRSTSFDGTLRTWPFRQTSVNETVPAIVPPPMNNKILTMEEEIELNALVNN